MENVDISQYVFRCLLLLSRMYFRLILFLILFLNVSTNNGIRREAVKILFDSVPIRSCKS